MLTKREVFKFFKGLESILEESLPEPNAVKQQIANIEAKPLSRRTPQELLACSENLCFYLALPHIFNTMTTVPGIDRSMARQSLLCEYYQKFPEFSSGNSFRRQGFPFGKDPTRPAAKIMHAWRKPYSKSVPANQAYPDMRLTKPFPFQAVLEAKYFVSESESAAEAALVKSVYEVAYYRGLPWECDYGCLIAYDASEGAYLRKAWEAVASKQLFWEDGIRFVIVVRGTGQRVSVLAKADAL